MTDRQRAVVVSLDGDLLDLLESMPDLEIIGFLDANRNAKDRLVPNLGGDEAWPALKAKEPDLKVVLAVDQPQLRKRLAASYGAASLVTVVAPDAHVSRLAEIGLGSVIQRNALISRTVRLGTACKINCGAALHHDVSVGDYSTIGPAAVVLGNVAIGYGCYVGAGATILPRRTVGDAAVVGAGAVVVEDVLAGAVVSGVPARVHEQRR